MNPQSMSDRDALVVGLLYPSCTIAGLLIGVKKKHPVVGFLVGAAAGVVLASLYLYAMGSPAMSTPTNPSIR